MLLAVEKRSRYIKLLRGIKGLKLAPLLQDLQLFLFLLYKFVLFVDLVGLFTNALNLLLNLENFCFEG